jgi:dipeptidyl aminopeptidase/acylaminoacyl peptidase
VRQAMARKQDTRAAVRIRSVAMGFALLAMMVGVLQASPRQLAVGEALTLAPDQALLAVAIDTSTALERMVLRGESALHGELVLDDLQAGRRIELYLVRAGRYRWDRVETTDAVSFDTGRDPEYSFEVRAGAVNYPGDFVFRPRNSQRALLHVANRGLGVIDRLERDYPALAVLPFEYVGHYPDPFPHFYRDERAGAPRPGRAVRTIEAPADLPLPVELLWRPATMQQASLSPAGDLLALVQRESGQRWRIELADLAHPERPRQTVFTSADPIRELGWSGDRRLVIGSADRGRDNRIEVVDLIQTANGSLLTERRSLPRSGRVLDLLPLDADHLLVASRGQGGQAVHRIDIGSRKALAAASFRWQDRLNHGIDGDFTWLTDAQGRLRAATVADHQGTNVVYHGAGDRFAEVMRVDDEHGFQPLRVSADGALIYGLTEQQREQRELVSFDPESGQLRTVFALPEVDIVAPLFDLAGELIGARYYEHGRLVSHYFDADERAVEAELRQAFPQRSISVLDRSRDGSQLLLSVEGADMPSVIHHYDRRRGVLTAVEHTRPWLDGKPLAPAHVIQATSADGLAVEGYLTLPAASGLRPLVVMPHGGPIGIRNQRHFDPEVQFLASLGYAVLQVNFRGSIGFGRAFREAGHGELGRRIEDDIDAALAVALAGHPLDASRICLVGSSYGGYSSLMSTLRNPGRFKCAAAISGFTDRVLQFTASDSGRSADIRSLLEIFIGNPNADLQAMTAGSPLYRYRELSVPLLLAHGTEDVRVDYEHTRRLVRMLNLAGHSPVLVTLFGEGHSVHGLQNREKLWHSVAGFLREHLES